MQCLLGLTSVFYLAGCNSYGTQTSSNESAHAVEIIANYADDNINPVPTVQNFVDAIKGNTKDSKFCDLRRLPKAYYLCTLFIIKEGEDLKAWSPKLAHEKIDDWIKENLNPFDFFSLALHSSKACQEIMKTDYTGLYDQVKTRI